jgi:hypothetical protein
MALALLVMMMLSAFSGTALAASPRAECEAAGGTFVKVQGTQTCTFAEVPGNNQGGVTKETDVSQKGSSRSSHPEEEEFCVGNRGGRHCPSGQN